MGSVGFVERVNCVAAARGQPQWWQWWGNATRSSLSGETQGSCHSMRGPLSFQMAFLASLSLVVARSSCVQTAQRHDSAGPDLRSTARASTLQLLARSVRCIVLGRSTISRPFSTFTLRVYHYILVANTPPGKLWRLWTCNHSHGHSCGYDLEWH